jgi:hypothetical protein
MSRRSKPFEIIFSQHVFCLEMCSINGPCIPISWNFANIAENGDDPNIMKYHEKII